LTEHAQDGSQGQRRKPTPSGDPARALADIQAEGLRAASELLERLLASDRNGSSPRPQARDGNGSPPEDSWPALLRRLAAGLAEPTETTGAVSVPIDSDTAAAPVRLVVKRSEHRAERVTAEVWLHNGTSEAVGPLVLGCGALTAADGSVLQHAQARFEPPDVELLPPRSSRGVLISLASEGELSAGVYRGTIQAEGAPKLWLPFEVVVE
jgi:hypothetical protein